MRYKNTGAKRLVLLVDGGLRVIEPGEVIEASNVFPNPSLVLVEERVVKNSKPIEKPKMVVKKHTKKRDEVQWSQSESQD